MLDIVLISQGEILSWSLMEGERLTVIMLQFSLPTRSIAFPIFSNSSGQMSGQ